MHHTLSNPRVVNKNVHRAVARVLYDVMHRWSTDQLLDIHQVIDILLSAPRTLRGFSRCESQLCVTAACVRIGHWCALNGRVGFKVTLPDGLSKRWKLLARHAIEFGIRLGRLPTQR